MQTNQLVDDMGQDNPLRRKKKMMRDDKTIRDDEWRQRQGVDEEDAYYVRQKWGLYMEDYYGDKNEDCYARQKRGQWGRYVTINRT